MGVGWGVNIFSPGGYIFLTDGWGEKLDTCAYKKTGAITAPDLFSNLCPPSLSSFEVVGVNRRLVLRPIQGCKMVLPLEGIEPSSYKPFTDDQSVFFI